MTYCTFALVLLVSAGSLAWAASPAQANPSKLPESTALKTDLADSQGDLQSLAARLDRARKAIAAARKEVQNATSLVKLIGDTDESLQDVIKEMKSLSKLPKLKILGPIAKNLEDIQKQLHKVRGEAEKMDRDVLKPLAARLSKTEKGVAVAIAECKSAAAQAGSAVNGLTTAQQLIQDRGYRALEVATLERSAKAVGPTADSLEAILSDLEKSAATIEAQAASVTKSLAAITSLRAGFTKFDKSLDPVEKTAAELKKVLSVKLSLKLFGKQYGFTVRQVLEGPSNVAQVVLKPVQALADKAMTDVMKKLNLQIKTPKEIAQLQAQIKSLPKATDQFETALTSFEKKLDLAILAKFEKSVQQFASK